MPRYAPCFRLVGDEGGTVAVIFGLFVFFGAAGAAMDVARGLSVRTSLQSELDAALIAGAARAQNTTSGLTAQVMAETYFAKSWRNKYGSTPASISISISNSEGKLTGTANTSVPTAFMKLFNYDTVEISVDSEVSLEAQDVEVALVLDTTGSMAGTKLETLKTAAKSLLTTVYKATDADQHVKVGIVPFAQYVNVGLPNRSKPWMSVPNDYSENKEWCRDEREVISRTNCRLVSAVGYNDGVPYNYQYEQCDYEYGETRHICTPYTDTYTWYGCAGSRGYPLNTLDEQYSTAIPGILNASCPSPLTPLTKEKETLQDQVDALTATGETYIPGGLAWGWRLLSNGEPFSEAVPYGQKVNGKLVRKILVLMTDGANTISPTYPEHWGSDAVLSNQLTAELCTNVKAKGIEVFTIAFDVTDTAIKDILRTCASDPAKYFDAASETALLTAFQTVARDMMPMHLSR